MTNAINVLIIIDTICVLATTIKVFIGKDGYKRGVKDGIKYSIMFLNGSMEYFTKTQNKKNSEQDSQ